MSVKFNENVKEKYTVMLDEYYDEQEELKKLEEDESYYACFEKETQEILCSFEIIKKEAEERYHNSVEKMRKAKERYINSYSFEEVDAYLDFAKKEADVMAAKASLDYIKKNIEELEMQIHNIEQEAKR